MRGMKGVLFRFLIITGTPGSVKSGKVKRETLLEGFFGRYRREFARQFVLNIKYFFKMFYLINSV